jgi:hypothetical protein
MCAWKREITLKKCHDCEAKIQESFELRDDQNNPYCLSCAESLLRGEEPELICKAQRFVDLMEE